MRHFLPVSKRKGILVAVFLLALSTGAHAQDPRSAGTRKMAARLQEVASKINPEKSSFFARERVVLHEPSIARLQDPTELLARLPPFAEDLLNSGRTMDALNAFERFEKLAQSHQPKTYADNKAHLATLKAVCWLRLAEQENCLTNHNVESCLLPIRGGGVHKLPKGSRKAIEVLTPVLRETNDLGAVWLLNLAYMTLGEHPDKVPPQWLIPPDKFQSEHDMKRFLDVAPGCGLDVRELSGGSVMEDFDNDGFLDIMISSIGFNDQMRYFRNHGDGTFTERTREAGLLGEVGGLNMIQSDYDNDGFADVLVLRGAWFGTEGNFPNSLLRNNGNGTFSDVTEEAGLLSFHPTQTATWWDYNNDGWIDLFIGNESTASARNPCELFRNNGDGTFTECAAAAGLAVVEFVKGVTSGDFNNDGRMDLYLSIKGQQNMLFRNDGPRDAAKGSKSDWRFTNVGRRARVTEPIHSFPTWFWDYDNDGWLDLFVSGYLIRDVGDVAADYLGLPHPAERARLYHNNRDGSFSDVTKDARLYKVLHTMGSNFGDLDNDGWLDMYLGTGDPELGTLIPNRMFRNAEGKTFHDVTSSSGTGHLQKGHGVSIGDLDNDGDLDIHEDMGGAFSADIYSNALFENPGHGNRWLKLKLEGVQSNRAAIGARIKVTVKTGGNSRDIYRTVTTGSSFGANPLRQELGLGSAGEVERLEVTWPVTGKAQVFTNLGPNKMYHVKEGSAVLTELPVKAFKFKHAAGSSHHHHH